jgi:hypothetical protein
MPLCDGKLIGKYRRLLIQHADLPEEAVRLAPGLRRLGELHAHRSLTDAEFAFWFVLLFTAERTRALTPRRTHEALAAKIGWLHNEDSAPPRALDTITNLNAFGMPGMVWQALGDWLHGRTPKVIENNRDDASTGSPLRLSKIAPDATEMLRYQATGARIVTIDLEAAIAGTPVAKTRDAFEFALHDLGHAYAFYLPEYKPEGQVRFFHLLQNDLPRLQGLAKADTKFAADLEYCMADMNTHPEHLRQYLRGVIIEAFYRLRKIDASGLYSEVSLRQFLDGLASVS